MDFSLFLFHPRLFRCILLLLLLTAWSLVVSAAPQFSVAPPPAWVREINANENNTAKGSAATESGARWLLRDKQIRVSGAQVERYYHNARKVLTTAGLEDSSQLEFEFEPSFQKLVIHYLRIRRGSEVIDALHPREIKIIQQEEEINERLFNGTLSAIAILNDVRVGDVIDYAWSEIGDNPIFGGKYADVLTLIATDPVDRLRARLLLPLNRTVVIKNQQTTVEPKTQTVGQEQEFVWERTAVPAWDEDDSTPAWFDSVARVQLSEFASWAEVAGWAVPLYQAKQPLSAALQQQLARWKAEFNSPEERLLAVCRFVQDNVRYLGIEIGQHSHQPHDPSLVFQRRFGDCKDKSLLLATMLNALGIEAHPALVDTAALHTLDEWQPSPLAFDHVIVRVRLNEKTFWVDATDSMQRGGLDQLSNAWYERALVIRPETNALETIPDPPANQPLIVEREIYHAENYNQPASLEVITQYNGIEADGMRDLLAGRTLNEMAKEWLNYYAKSDPQIEADGAPQVEDDEAANRITVIEKYRIRDFWRDRERGFYPAAIYNELTKPRIAQRQHPLGIKHPLHVKQTTELHLPAGLRPNLRSGSVIADALRLDYHDEYNNDVLTLHYQLRSLRDHVPPEKTAKHIASLDQMIDAIAYSPAVSRPALNDFGLPAWMLIAPFVIFGGVLLLAGVGALWYTQKRRGSALQPGSVIASKWSPGQRPETAFRLSEGEIFSQRLVHLRCVCQRPWPTESSDAALKIENFSFDGRKLAVVQFDCPSCRHSNVVYFEPPVPVSRESSNASDYGQASSE